MAETARWYVVHTYSGYENTVKATIEKTVQSRQLQEQILTVSIPMETVTEISDSGVSKTYDRKLYPGYVFVKMVYSDSTWHAIRGIRGVAGFVGPSGEDPIPLTDWRHRMHSRRSFQFLHRRCRGNRGRKEQRQRGRYHVWP